MNVICVVACYVVTSTEPRKTGTPIQRRIRNDCLSLDTGLSLSIRIRGNLFCTTFLSALGDSCRHCHIQHIAICFLYYAIVPVFDMICARSLNFVHRCLSHDSDLIRFISYYCINCCPGNSHVLVRMLSSVCNGMTVTWTNYSLSIWTMLSSHILPVLLTVHTLHWLICCMSLLWLETVFGVAWVVYMQ